MSEFTRTPNRLRRAFVMGGISLMALTGCEKINTEGKGNGFTIQGKVVEVRDNSVTLTNITAIATEGKATEWFNDDDDHKIHDNYKNEDDCDLIVVGEEFDVDNNPQKLKDVKPGEVVKIEGAIRDSWEDCGTDYESTTKRAVFTHLIEKRQ